MKVPRDVNDAEAARALKRPGFVSLRQTGSHLILRKDRRTVVVPQHKPLNPGTLKGVIRAHPNFLHASFEDPSIPPHPHPLPHWGRGSREQDLTNSTASPAHHGSGLLAPRGERIKVRGTPGKPRPYGRFPTPSCKNLRCAWVIEQAGLTLEQFVAQL